MMPSAQQVTIKQTMKPKIAFSIESIVGDRVRSSSPGSYCEDSSNEEEKLPRLAPSAVDMLTNQYTQLIKRARALSSPHNFEYSGGEVTRRLSVESSDQHNSSSSNNNNNNNNNNDSISNNNNNNSSSKADDSTSDSKLSTVKQQSRSPSPAKETPAPPPLPPSIVAPIPVGLIRPMVSQQLPPHYPDTPSPHAHSSHLLAQFQAAAALANVQAVQNGFPPQHLPPHLHNPNMPRDSYPLYPWLLSRHGRIFPHRFPGNFLLQPFRKPKRVRTAFSPSQLLKLEHAFEGNHYVVGSERKQLAQQLSLTETQVKVWFQNRRTKFKRTQQEDGSDSKSGNKSGGSPAHFDEDDEEDDDEMIDIGDECPTTDDEEMMTMTTTNNGA